MKYLYWLLCYISMLLPMLSHATVGGPQSIEVLGYDASEQKVYLLRHFYDGRGRLPQLYYYLLTSRTPQQQIGVRSLYINPQTQQIDVDQDPQKFNQALEKIKNRLQMLQPIPHQTLQLKILQRKQKLINVSNTTIRQYQYRYQLKRSGLYSPVVTAYSYTPKIEMSQSYLIPNHNKIIAVVKYQGIAMEGGYWIEDALILK